MPFTTRRRTRATRPVVTTAPRTAPRGGLFSRRRRAAPRAVPAKRTHMRTAPAHHHRTAPAHHHRTAPVHTQRRRPSMKDKVSGALLRLKGSLTHRPAVKAAGTRRMHGTDGRVVRRRRFF